MDVKTRRMCEEPAGLAIVFRDNLTGVLKLDKKLMFWITKYASNA